MDMDNATLYIPHFWKRSQDSAVN